MTRRDTATTRRRAGDGFVAGVRTNPILVHEGRARARSWSMPVAMAVYVSLLGAFALVMFSLAISGAPDNHPSATDMANVAFLTLGFQLVLQLLIVPPLVADSIASEREQNTIETLLTGILGARNVVRFKLLASTALPLLLVVVAFPVLLAVFLYAGVGAADLLLAELVTIAAVMAIGAVSLAVGTMAPRSLSATLVAYGVVLGIFVVLPLLGVVLHRGPARLLSASVHPFVFANPFYVFHTLTLGPTPAGLDLGHLVGLLFQRHATASTWGPLVQPWELALVAQVLVVSAGIRLASWRLSQRRLAQSRMWRVLRQPLRVPGAAAPGSPAADLPAHG